MDSTKSLAKIVIVIGLILSVVDGPTASARDMQWESFTSFKYVRQMRVINDTLYAATSGGILAITGFDEPGLEFTGIDGLGTNDVTDIIEDASGQKWVAAFGRLVRFDGEVGHQYLFFDVDDNLIELYCLVDDGEYLWVGTEVGLVLFSKTDDGGQISDSYQLFDDLNPEPAVYDIALEGDSIWLATSSGLAVADRTDLTLLKSYSRWAGYYSSNCPELGTDTVINAVRFQAETYIATRRGVWRMVDDGTDCFEAISVGVGADIHCLKSDRDSLFVFFDDDLGGGWGYISDGIFHSMPSTGLPSEPINGATFGDHRWVAVADGIYVDEAGSFVEYPFTGLPANNVWSMTIDGRGVVTAGFRTTAMASFEDSAWSEFDLSVSQAASVVMTDSAEHTWMATIGNGLWLWDGDTLKNYDENNSMLRGVPDKPPAGLAFVIVTGLETDGRYLYVANYRAINKYPIVIADLNNLDDISGWDSVGTINGFTDLYAGEMDLYEGKLAIATEFSGVFVCDVGDEPVGDEIVCQHYTRENSLLISNYARTVRYSPEGELWVGTNFGLSRYDSGIDRFVDVSLPPDMSSDVRGLAFDGRGNLWIGSRDGLGRRDAVTGDIEVFNTFNSEIVADEVNSVFCDPFTSDVYVATTTGFSVIRSEIGTPVTDVNKIVVFPNPFVIDGDDDRLVFNLDRDGVIRIFNVAGELVREMAIGDWDGRNQSGQPVASGVYVYVVTDSDGNVGKGKFLLVRQ